MSVLAVVALLIAVAACVPVVRALAGPARAFGWGLAALAAATVVATDLAFERTGAAAATAVAADRPLRVVDSEDGYVGSEACRSCHPAEHASWHGSFHRTMTQVVSRDALVPEFDRLELDWFGEPVVLEWRGDELWTKFVRRGGRPGPVERPIAQLTGSHHLQVLWYTTGEGRELAPVPVCYKIAEQRWIPLTTVFVLPPTFRDPPDPGAWNRSCNECHTTDARPRFEDGRWQTHVSEFGIACEACHGPGLEHASANRNPVVRYGHRFAGEDASIVQPSTLPPARSAEACGHCHSVRILRRRHFDTWRSDGSPFEPGDDLQASHLVVHPRDGAAPELREELRRNPNFYASSFWSDGEVRLSGREFSGLRESPCYQHGHVERQIDCTSCHAMHTDDGAVDPEWRDGQMKPGMRGNEACTQCHEALATPDGLHAHTRHGPGSLGNSCYDCHMGHTSIGLMKASRSHRIQSPDVAVELRTGRPNACNQCHLDRTLAWTAQHLHEGWGIAVPELDDEQRTVAASVRWLLSGDAGQRMLAAWSFGWQPARDTAGDDWLAPYLARLLDDPYYVVRFNAARSLRSLVGYGGSLHGYDYLLPEERAGEFVDRVTSVWQSRYTGGARPRVLLADRGLDRARFDRLYARRDDRPVYLAE